MHNPVTGGTNGNRCLELNGTHSYSNLVEGNDFGWTGWPPDNTTAVQGLEITSQGNIVRRNVFHHMRGVGLGFYDKVWAPVPAPLGNLH